MTNLLIPLLFHLNQHLNEMASVASKVCYRGLLQTLRANPEIKANIHISGTLITALKWLDPEPLEMIRDGLTDGQFEIVGSTFAQNVPYASDNWDNAKQIELHKQVIMDTFGVAPTAFWNSERCWRQSLVPLIADAGYQTITIEDHILEASGGQALQTYHTRLEEHSLNVVRDDEKLKHYFNFAAWFGDTQFIQQYLDTRKSDSKELGEAVLAYAEDAEAMGLWGYFQGVNPGQTWERLDSLLKALISRNDIKAIHFANIPAPAQEISPLTDGAASWMNASLAKEGLPYHEDGYSDWFDFNTRSPKLEKFRKIYGDIRKHLQTAEQSAKQDGAKKIFALGLHCYLTHQYEFGCIGIGGDDYRGWLGANAAQALTSAVALAALNRNDTEPIQFTIVDDINRDEQDEWLHLNETNLLITSALGGRLLYWLNMQEGQLLVGNPSAVVPGKYLGDSTPPEKRMRPDVWFPLPSEQTETHQESKPTRMAKFLPPWIWNEYPSDISLKVRKSSPPSETPALTAQQGAFCDEIFLDGHPVFSPGDVMNVEGSREGVRFLKQIEPLFYYRKKYAIEKDGITVNYTFTNKGEHVRRIIMTTNSELSLDYQAILQHGRQALEFLPDSPGVINPLTGETLILSASQPIIEVIKVPALLGLIVGLKIDFSIPPGESTRCSISLQRY